MKDRIFIIIQDGAIQSIQVSPRLASDVEVIAKITQEPESEDDNEPLITLSEMGVKKLWQKFEANNFEMLTDEVYQQIDHVFSQ